MKTISVEVFNIRGANAIAVPQGINVFYDTELLAVIHRHKFKSSGLVSTTVWIWQGRNSEKGEKEEHKIQELARRYGTQAELIRQHSEPPELIHSLGSRLAIRQGARSHWSPENTTMHLVRSRGSFIYIDEVNLSVKNLCSAFSYCLTVLDTIYVWHGCGSIESERQAALEYAQGFAPVGQQPLVLEEGDNDNDDIFWMILGGEDFANADYWKWRRIAPTPDPRVWRVESNRGEDSICFVSSFASEKNLSESVYVIDCIWEFFVLVGKQARGHRQNIRLGLDIALNLSKKVSAYRPFPPTVHVLVLPSQLPLDLRLNFRDLNEGLLNDEDIPDHMNILSSVEALEHLQRSKWDMTRLRDERMLPLGVDLSHIP
ncbi:hypothetical protein AMATHDRAFT_75292 [Amanita thiersii Skay4041]|uniref:DUF7904 domain-containing protein n=1 Tax=Amanita thiersii Skay4041 TaxID=703135 RepID=A0A2A9NNK9_9AGAR|nr:hypothetical protein AMATHDRAFT_75292 [Amanita thiersii Skay4041]